MQITKLQQIKRHILESLVAIKQMGPRRPNQGICYNLLDTMMVDHHYSLADADTHSKKIIGPYMLWSEYSGDIHYPVACKQYERPADAFNLVEDLWGGEYGAARLRLLDFLIEHFENDILQQKDEHAND